WWSEQCCHHKHPPIERQGKAQPIEPSCDFHRGRRFESADQIYSEIFPRNVVSRHFAMRAAFCLITCPRPLTGRELFAASTTRVLPNDIDWPSPLGDLGANIRDLM